MNKEKIIWSEASQDDINYFTKLVSDYTKDHPDYKPIEPDMVKEKDVRELYKKASAYYRTDEPEIIFD